VLHESTTLFSSFNFFLLLIRERYVVATTSEGFSTSGNAVVTSQERAARTKVAYNLLDDMNGLAAFSQLCKGQLTRVHSPSTTMGPVDCQKMGSRFVGQ